MYESGHHTLFDATEFQVQATIVLYIYPVFLLFGSLGNISGIILMKNFANNVWSTCLYLVFLLTLDLFILYVECGNDWYFYMTGEYLSSQILLASDAICKVYMFLYSFFLHMMSWIVVALSVETMIAVRYPHHLYHMCTRERAQAILLLLTVLLLSVNLHFFWTFGIAVPSDETLITKPTCLYINELSNNFRDIVWPSVEFVIRDLIPLIIISTSTTITTITLFKRRKQQQKMETMLVKYFMDLVTLNELKLAITVLCCSYTVIQVCRVTETVIINLANHDFLPKMSYPKLELLRTVINAMVYAYLSFQCVIFLYLCTKFRKMIKLWFQKVFRPCWKLCWPCSRQHKVSLTKTNDRSYSPTRGPIILRRNPKCSVSTNI